MPEAKEREDKQVRKSKIEWCDATWNPVTGCEHGCPYCYAAAIARRFSGDVRENLKQTDAYSTHDGKYILTQPFVDSGGAHRPYPFGFSPTLHTYKLGELSQYKRGRNIFVGSMCDLFGEFIPDSWIEQVMDACWENRQHNYLFLTKHPQRYQYLRLPDGKNFWYGMTITGADKPGYWTWVYQLPKRRRRFVSIEPLRDEIDERTATAIASLVDWVIIGAETGSHKGKTVPEKEWVDDIVRAADAIGTPVFMKNSMIPVVGEEGMRRDLPPELVHGEYVQERRTAHCIVCGAEGRKKDMVTVTGRKGRDGKNITIGQVHQKCMCGLLEKRGMWVPPEWREGGE